MKRGLIPVSVIIVILSLSACGKYSNDYTTLVLNDNIAAVNDSEVSNVWISTEIKGNGLVNAVTSAVGTYWVYVDGKAVYSLPNTKEGVFSLNSSKKHKVYVSDDQKLFGKKSNEVEFDVSSVGYTFVSMKVTLEKNKSLSLVCEIETIKPVDESINEIDNISDAGNKAIIDARTGDNGWEEDDGIYDQDDGRDMEDMEEEYNEDYDWDVGDWNEDGFWFPDSSTRYLNEWELDDLDSEALRQARNEIYARHGRIFTSNDLDSYFRQFDWYEPEYTAEEFDRQIKLNDFEKKNIELIKKVENQIMD